MRSSRSGPLTIADRLRKLRAMSPAEIWTRMRYEAYCRVERTRHTRGALERNDRVREAIVPSLARSADWRSALLRARAEGRNHFFTGAEQRDATRAMFLSRFPAEHLRARQEAERILRGEF